MYHRITPKIWIGFSLAFKKLTRAISMATVALRPQDKFAGPMRDPMAGRAWAVSATPHTRTTDKRLYECATDQNYSDCRDPKNLQAISTLYYRYLPNCLWTHRCDPDHGRLLRSKWGNSHIRWQRNYPCSKSNATARARVKTSVPNLPHGIVCIVVFVLCSGQASSVKHSECQLQTRGCTNSLREW